LPKPALITASGRAISVLIDAIHFWRAGESLSDRRYRKIASTICSFAMPHATPADEQELIYQARAAPGARRRRTRLHGLMALPAAAGIIEVPLSGVGRAAALTRAQLLFNAAQSYLRPCA
jgi:hypothetical protein